MAQQLNEALNRRREVLRATAAAQRLGVSKPTFYRIVKRGELPKGFPIGGGRARGWFSTDLDVFLDACAAKARGESTQAAG